MGSNLYYVKGGRAVEMSEQPYSEEKVLQDLIAQNPNILLRSSEPDGARLFLVAQEFSIAEGGDSSNSYAIDHLMIDQDGVPVLVEVKRSSDTRSRREVVAQMLDYASRASTWDVGRLRESFLRCNTSMTGSDYDTDDFWGRVANCLKAERLRLVFAADLIPDTLKTLIEFLNRNLVDIEVYGVEVRQYQAQDATLLTSSVVGGGSVDGRRASLRSVEWDADAFSAYLLDHDRKDAVEVSQELQAFSADHGLSCQPGQGTKFPSFLIKRGQLRILTASSWVKGNRHVCTLEFCIRDLLEHLPDGWNDERLRATLTDLPSAGAARMSKMLWDTPHYLYIEMRVLSTAEDMEALKTAILGICGALAEKQNNISIT